LCDRAPDFFTHGWLQQTIHATRNGWQKNVSIKRHAQESIPNRVTKIPIAQ